MDPVALTILGIDVHHPASVLTNLFLAVQCFHLAGRVPPGPRAALWRGFFRCLGVGAAFGAVKHGFPDLTPGLYATVRFVSNVGLGVAVTMAQLAVVRKHTARDRLRTALSTVAIVQLTAFVATSLWTQDFLVPAVDLAVGMTPVLLVEAAAGLRGRVGSRWVAGGLAVALTGGALYAVEAAPSPWFNHVDVAHLLLMGTVALVFRGVALASVPVRHRRPSWS